MRGSGVYDFVKLMFIAPECEICINGITRFE